MLKRHQVLLTDWLADYMKYIADRYDLSFSEVIRLCLCLHCCDAISDMHPKKKFSVSSKKHHKI